jgi:hypothetical protein
MYTISPYKIGSFSSRSITIETISNGKDKGFEINGRPARRTQGWLPQQGGLLFAYACRAILLKAEGLSSAKVGEEVSC